MTTVTGRGCSAGGYFCPAGTSVVSGTGGGTRYGVRCTAGAYCNAASLTAARVCTAGYFCVAAMSVLPGSTHRCTAGYYCPAGSSSATQFLCPAGQTCPIGSSAPAPCPAGFYCSGGQTLPCPGGYFCPQNTVRLPCSLLRRACTSFIGLSHSFPSLFLLLAFVFRRQVDGTANPCAAGTYCPQGQGAAGLFVCQPGTFCPAAVANYTLCTSGSYCPTANLGAPTAWCVLRFIDCIALWPCCVRCLGLFFEHVSEKSSWSVCPSIPFPSLSRFSSSRVYSFYNVRLLEFISVSSIFFLMLVLVFFSFRMVVPPTNTSILLCTVCVCLFVYCFTLRVSFLH
jgi:hypothetical protein